MKTCTNLTRWALATASAAILASCTAETGLPPGTALSGSYTHPASGVRYTVTIDQRGK